MSGVMDGIRILEVADHTFVPAASAILADWGADVIKIEHAVRGDAARGLAQSGSVDLSGNVHAIMEHANRGKRSLGLDLKTEEGLAVLHRLIAISDVFLVNKPPIVRERLKITETEVRAHNPDIVYAAGTAWGPKGPEGNRGGYDMTSFWCRSGAAMGAWYVDDERMPSQPGPAFGDSMGAMTIAGGISAALLKRERTGEPQSLEVSLLATGMWAMASGIAMSHVNGTAWRPFDLGKTVFNPLLGTFPTNDGRVVNITCLQPLKYWQEFCGVIGRPELIKDPRFVDHETLTANAGEAKAVVDEVIGSRSLAEVVELLANFNGQWTPVLDSLEIIDDPQSIANDYVQDLENEAGVPFKLVTTPVQFNGAPSPVGRAPGFNEHGDEILTGDLGMDMDEVIDLKVKGAVT
ncbi:MAG: crotonobetainyl-CoA:carnitine CoA-transferase CaiB-like acyl-CoA transferase [Candidatus Aldehydirespiratoraceae bacterium]|jgi:crotonobetainyl-CoA:carnitine CoA-transferase CaiB-like acyl-CoA transferase